MKNLIIILAICSISCITDYNYKAISIEPTNYDYKRISAEPTDYEYLAKATYYSGYEPSFNSDTSKYGGEGRVNLEIIKPIWGGIDKELCHIEINIAPFSVVYLKPKFKNLLL